MQEAEIERKESDQRYISVIDQKQKELETSSIEISRLRIDATRDLRRSCSKVIRT